MESSHAQSFLLFFQRHAFALRLQRKRPQTRPQMETAALHHNYLLVPSRNSSSSSPLLHLPSSSDRSLHFSPSPSSLSLKVISSCFILLFRCCFCLFRFYGIWLFLQLLKGESLSSNALQAVSPFRRHAVVSDTYRFVLLDFLGKCNVVIESFFFFLQSTKSVSIIKCILEIWLLQDFFAS